MTACYKYAKRILPDENSPYTVDTLPMHKDTYFFGYGIDIDKPIEMANQIIWLKEQLEASERARKEAIKLIRNNQRKDEFVKLNEWQARDLLDILEMEG